jgi:hypothetical protein
LDRWYGRYPDESGDLRERFRNPDPRQHYAAWWELYLHELLTRLGFLLTVHPGLPESSHRPDFLVERDGESFYLEAATVFSGIEGESERNRGLELAVLDIINTLDASAFFVHVRFEQVGSSMPRRGAITGPIQSWLAGLDPDEVATRDALELPTTRISYRDWELDLRAQARPTEFRGLPSNRLVGVHGAYAGFVNHRTQLLRSLERKKRQCGTPDRPLVIALLAVSGFVDDREITSVLFGSEGVQVSRATRGASDIRFPDGLWVGRRGPASKKVSAVLVGVGLTPERCAQVAPTVWHHYAPTHDLDARLPFATEKVVGGVLVHENQSMPPNELLGLPPDWPGPEPPFDR